MWFGTAYKFSMAALGNYYFTTVIHELGHAFGLKHSQEAGGVANVAVPAAHDDSEFTVMSYRSYVGGPLSCWLLASLLIIRAAECDDPMACLEQFRNEDAALVASGLVTIQWGPP